MPAGSFLAGVLGVPMLVDGTGDAHQPVAVFGLFQQISGGEKFDAVGGGIAQRFQQSSGDERRDVMRLAIEHPRRLLRREASRQLAEQH